MHLLKKISVFLCTFCIAFVLGIYYERLTVSFYPNGQVNKERYYIPQKENIDNSAPAVLNEEIITANTKLIVIEHDLETGEEFYSESNIPIKYIGLNRKKFLEEMESYETAPALNDLKKGFISLEVISFSKTEIKLQKNFSKGTLNLHFYVLAKDNKLVVYYEDLETIFLATDINVDSLPSQVQLEILKKKYFETEEELYNFLESYSS